MKNKHKAFLILGTLAIAYVGMHYSRTSKAFQDYNSVQCYNPKVVDTGYYVDFEGNQDKVQFGSITFAGRQNLASYNCHAQDGSDIAVSCSDPRVADDGYIINFRDNVPETNDNRVAEVEVLKVQFSGIQKVASLPCYNQK